MLQPGKYTGKVVDYYVHVTKADLPAPKILFAVTMPEGNVETVGWQGSFKEGKAREIAMEGMITCGFKGALSDFAKGPVSGCLDTTLDLVIDVAHEQYLDDQGQTKTYARVNWINPIGGSKFRKAMSHDDFSYCVTSMGLDREFQAIAKKNGVSIERPRVVSAQLSDIPF